MEVRVWTRTPGAAELAGIGAISATFEEALACAYVSLHLPLTEQTRRLIGAAAFARMTPETVFINIARGAIVDTDALVAALRSAQIAGAALDVVTPSPLPSEHPLWSMPNVWLTSHSAAFSIRGAPGSAGYRVYRRAARARRPAAAAPGAGAGGPGSRARTMMRTDAGKASSKRAGARSRLMPCSAAS